MCFVHSHVIDAAPIFVTPAPPVSSSGRHHLIFPPVVSVCRKAPETQRRLRAHRRARFRLSLLCARDWVRLLLPRVERVSSGRRWPHAGSSASTQNDPSITTSLQYTLSVCVCVWGIVSNQTTINRAVPVDTVDTEWFLRGSQVMCTIIFAPQSTFQSPQSAVFLLLFSRKFLRKLFFSPFPIFATNC
jgi:hypothetical protein